MNSDIKQSDIDKLAEVLRKGFGEMAWSRYIDMARVALKAGYRLDNKGQEINENCN